MSALLETHFFSPFWVDNSGNLFIEYVILFIEYTNSIIISLAAATLLFLKNLYKVNMNFYNRF